MNIDALIDDIQHIIDTAPLVERTEWDRQAIRRLEQCAVILRLYTTYVNEATHT